MKLYYANIDSMDLERCFDDDDVFVLYSPAPLSPDVAAAMERVESQIRRGDATIFVQPNDARTLIRAVRAPRLTGEQHEVVKMLYGVAALHGAFRDESGQAVATEVRAAFPELVEVEG